MQPRGQFQQLTHPPRSRQGRTPHVKAEVDVIVDRPAQIGEHALKRCGALAEQRGHLAAVEHRLVSLTHECPSRPLGRFEQLQRTDMQRMLARLC